MEIKGLSKENIVSISNHKGEDSWVNMKVKLFIIRC